MAHAASNAKHRSMQAVLDSGQGRGVWRRMGSLRSVRLNRELMALGGRELEGDFAVRRGKLEEV